MWRINKAEDICALHMTVVTVWFGGGALKPLLQGLWGALITTPVQSGH